MIYIKFWFWLSFVSFIVILANTLGAHSPSSIKLAWYFTVFFKSAWFSQVHAFLIYDQNTLYYIFTISVISTFAIVHTLNYMGEDQKKEKFLLLLNGFAFSMVILVLTRNFCIIFLCWEFLGLTSFFLINHNDTQTSTVKSALKAFSYNRFSDFSLLISIVVFWTQTKSFNISPETVNTINQLFVTSTEGSWDITRINLALFFLFLAASIKSVQVFSYMWLPDSMKAPAPASALIHSATLVAAGFYLIFIFKDVFLCYWGLNWFNYIGLTTCFIGVICAVYQTDLKKILAFSTIANCGFMLCLLARYDINVFLLYFTLHGIFKSAAFMFSGDMIVAQNHRQDIRKYNDLLRASTVNLSGLIICMVMLAGFPITTVFHIKHSYSTGVVTNFAWYNANAFFYYYSFFSMLYSINFILRVFFNFSYFKNVKDYHGEEYSELNFLVNNVYTILGVLLSIAFISFEETYVVKSYTTSDINCFYIYRTASTISCILPWLFGWYYLGQTFDKDPNTLAVTRIIEVHLSVVSIHSMVIVLKNFIIKNLTVLWKIVKKFVKYLIGLMKLFRHLNLNLYRVRVGSDVVGEKKTLDNLGNLNWNHKVDSWQRTKFVMLFTRSYDIVESPLHWKSTESYRQYLGTELFIYLYYIHLLYIVIKPFAFARKWQSFFEDVFLTEHYNNINIEHFSIDVEVDYEYDCGFDDDFPVDEEAMRIYNVYPLTHNRENTPLITWESVYYDLYFFYYYVFKFNLPLSNYLYRYSDFFFANNIRYAFKVYTKLSLVNYVCSLITKFIDSYYFYNKNLNNILRNLSWLNGLWSLFIFIRSVLYSKKNKKYNKKIKNLSVDLRNLKLLYFQKLSVFPASKFRFSLHSFIKPLLFKSKDIVYVTNSLLRKQLVFNKSKYSRSRQYCKNIVLLGLLLNIVLMFGLNSAYYTININAGYFIFIFYFFIFFFSIYIFFKYKLYSVLK